ncbi:MAG TPA: hypothetical protein VFV67_26300 [Actinophytocola sp.]|uniref:hypothetical protein n=1 Tax=Actinophytocola sp. TaxID=1872138 RepID=UPI002DB5F725|nr:hypothetical protein [Actinophytocola sp.]HEU5474173.1 hypothetical protein [Actinophytocola sp.]
MTTQEQREYLTAGLVPVDCHGCPTRVLVRKSSAEQTSVQWTGHPAASCPEFAARVAAGELSARIEGCPKLRASIEHAVAEGLIEVRDG